MVPASALLDAVGTDAGRVIVGLDVDPAVLRTSEQASYEAVRFHVDCPAGQLGDAVALRLPSPLAVFVTVDGSDDPGLAETAQQLADAGRIPGLASGHTIGEVADFLAVLAHADVGYVARARDTAEVLALLSGHCRVPSWRRRAGGARGTRFHEARLADSRGRGGRPRGPAGGRGARPGARRP